MKARSQYPDPIPGLADTKLAWLLALVAGGLVLLGGALAVDLHNQKRRLESVGAQLRQTAAVREAENKNLAARSRTAESAISRLAAVQTEAEADLKALGTAYTQREPLVKQATEVQTKLQAVANDLLELAKSDPDARAIVRKYNIQQNTPATGAGLSKP